jgi:hypothetical protein
MPVLMADNLACLLDLSLVEWACLSKISMLKQGKLARLIFRKVKSLVYLNISKTELVPIG